MTCFLCLDINLIDAICYFMRRLRLLILRYKHKVDIERSGIPLLSIEIARDCHAFLFALTHGVGNRQSPSIEKGETVTTTIRDFVAKPAVFVSSAYGRGVRLECVHHKLLVPL